MVVERIAQTIAERSLAGPDTPVVLMVSGGSDSTALTYVARELADCGQLGPLAIMHVNHMLRGAEAEADAAFVADLAQTLGIPLYLFEIDVAAKASASGGNVEAVGRQERYAAAMEALQKLCQANALPTGTGCVFTAHTQNDRVENFYMRSIVGTGPGGFRSMVYANGSVARPCLDVTREQLRDYLAARARDNASSNDVALVRDEHGNLWRDDATNAHTDRFRTFVRHEIVPKARERNPRLEETLCRSMNLIADEDDMLDAMACDIVLEHVSWAHDDRGSAAPGSDCTIAPGFASLPLPLQRRAAAKVLHNILGLDERIETASVQAVIDAFADGAPVSGYTNNIQGNLALSANKHGLRIEPMAQYRARRKGAESA